jgi:hypothetical protein
MDFQNAILSAIAARDSKDYSFDGKARAEVLQLLDRCKQCQTGESSASRVFLTALCTDFEDVSILDVGSGQMATAKLIVDACSSVKAYTCIDPEELSPNADHIKKKVEIFCHVSKRFEDVVKYDVMQAPYDIVVIDVEPHGREVEVYESIKKYLTDTHLVILKHIGHMNTGGSSIADGFITEYMDKSVVYDYFAQSVLNPLDANFRDIFLIMQKTKCPMVGLCQSQAHGEIYQWCDPELRAYTKNLSCHFSKPIRLDGNSSARHQ